MINCPNCSQEKANGSLQLRFALNLILKYQPIYNISKLVISDNLEFDCQGDKIKLYNLRVITHGKPWYMEFGFRPYDTLQDKEDTEIYEHLEYKNGKIDTIKANSPIVQQIIIKTIREENLDIN